MRLVATEMYSEQSKQLCIISNVARQMHKCHTLAAIVGRETLNRGFLYLTIVFNGQKLDVSR